ncbi:hypothetical protein HB852_00935 [Listeria grandensis]|nr:hypothetical protein [Listeria grandensis]
MMKQFSIMHQNEMDLKLSKFNDAVNRLQGLPKRDATSIVETRKAAKYIVIEPFESMCEKLFTGWMQSIMGFGNI